MKLNPQQQLAVAHNEGPLLILAGAGSGKTRALTERYARLIQEGRCQAHEILAVTFTNKAGNEMKERIVKRLGNSIVGSQISTFHSFCANMLRKEHYYLEDYDHSFTIWEPDQVIAQIRPIIRDITKIKAKTIAGYISKLKNEMITADILETRRSDNPYIRWDKVEMLLESFPEEHLDIVYHTFPLLEKVMKKENVMDFDDLLVLSAEMFRKHPILLEKYTNQYRYIMVDEYQDVNTVQFALSHLLSSHHENIMVVGDDAQAIYAFRGSDIYNILSFEKLYPHAKVIKFEQNYRSTKNILRASNSLIFYNTKQKKKTLFTENTEGDKVRVVRCADSGMVAQFIAQDIKKKWESGRSLSDFAVLYRNHVHSLSLEKAFREWEVPYYIVKGKGFYERAEIQDMLAYLRVVHKGNDIASFDRAIRVPKRRIADQTIKKFVQQSHSRPFWEALHHPEEIIRMQKVAKQELKEFVEHIEFLRSKMDTMSVGDMVEYILRVTRYHEMELFRYDEDTRQAKEENLDTLVREIREWEDERDAPRLLGSFLEDVTLFQQNMEAGKDGEAVPFMTMHGAKGLEFPSVYIPGLAEGIFPSRQIATLDELEEERRLCYVGMTRAMNELFMLVPGCQVLKDGRVMPLSVSRFVEELDREAVQYINVSVKRR